VAGNRSRFEEYLQRANDFVWSEKWPEAIAMFRRALRESPNDANALMAYAWSLFNAGEMDEALQVYQRLARLTPDDPGPYERIGDILERKEENEGAAQMYLRAAEIYRAQKLSKPLYEALEAAVRVNPRLDTAWDELLKHYQEQGNITKAVEAALWLSHLYQAQDPQEAIAICRQIQRFVPNDRRLGLAMTLLQSNRPLPPPHLLTAESAAPEPDDAWLDEEAGEGNGSDPGSPTEIARQRALESLAESLFSEERPQAVGLSQEQVSLLISKAVDAQTRGDLTEAVDAYRRLIRGGVTMPSIHFNLGLLFKEQMHFEQAIEQFQLSLPEAEYVLGSHFALGECYQAQGQFEQALEHFLEVVKIVDLTTVKRNEAGDLIRVYEGLAQNLINTGEPERVQQLSNSLVDFLSQRGWEEEVMKARERLDSLARSGTVLSLAEIISLPGSEDVLRSIAMAQEYQRRKKIYAALEELLNAVGLAPFYLPLHHLLGTLFLENGNIEAALDKFRTIANTYEIRQQTSLALTTYQQILSLSPLDINIHTRVIEMLTQRGRIDEALEQRLQLADAYYQLAQPDRAREAYVEALRLAPRGSADRRWQVRILHRMADLDLQRLSWPAAIKDYEQITKIAPDDERAHLGLLRLYPRVGKTSLGIGALDKLIRRYLETQRTQKAIAVLEELVQEDPTSIPLRARIAQIYLNTGQRDKALEHLDVLGDLQLEAGQKQAAVKTIEAIIALNPPNFNVYAQLYTELTGREPPMLRRAE